MDLLMNERHKRLPCKHLFLGQRIVERRCRYYKSGRPGNERNRGREKLLRPIEIPDWNTQDSPCGGIATVPLGPGGFVIINLCLRGAIV
jgi:hypothetical protein